MKRLLVPFLFSCFNISFNILLDLQDDLQFVFIEGSLNWFNYLDFISINILPNIMILAHQ